MLEAERLDRLRRSMESLGVTAVLTADPINVFYGDWRTEHDGVLDDGCVPVRACAR